MTPDERIAAEGEHLGTCFTQHTYPNGDWDWLPDPTGTHDAYRHNGEIHLIPKDPTT